MVRKTRNDTDFWYCMYDPSVKYILLDTNGNETGEVAPKYGSAIPFWANISPAIGQAQFEQFGNLGSYDKVIVTRDMTCPINETAVLFIDKQPEYVTVTAYEVGGETQPDSGDEEEPDETQETQGTEESQETETEPGETNSEEPVEPQESTPVAVTYQLPKYDYIVKRVAKGLDAIAIAVRKVEIG